MSLDGSGLPQPSQTIEAEPSTTADVLMKVTEEANKTPGGTPQRRDAEFMPLVHCGFVDVLGGNLPSSYTEPSMSVYDVSSSWVLNCP